MMYLPDSIHSVIGKLYRCTISLRMDTSGAPLCAFFFWSPIPNYLLFTALKGLYVIEYY